MNLPNKLTVSRIILTFVFMFFLFSKGLTSKSLALVVFIAAALTDLFDGMIAKSRNLITDFGKIMDPIADKILVLAAFLSFIQLQLIPAWCVIVIIGRELIITSLRLFAFSKGVVIAASKGGKHKTVSQMAAIIIILASLVFKDVMKAYFFWSPVFDKVIGSIIYLSMLSTVMLTLISGISYIWENRHLFLGLKNGQK
ncbi:MAG: CDP-diacylglycerol--glycerol-3-phosphate 3-phosphatidyltransferase [Omnitrophica WOR_2 bacterium RIFCSPLOWO2_12_FULL_46_30]|nr:MAG: CDP-diacylglycerol--glycerol-3-phosphate 3-phosphatidyltransferase [Omnitrophica WOR_2 bacterium RIFCSPHIGHO2_02_FULL_46_37]OGX43820.1 MAG: CDP-diacylglycerol--glycerol-3-phosphate 3-phosphatidyltransferase [Omnitrophica WOR_2 bacterium RIFCSPLOWO2_02_FULL_45_28]OGX52059.1 MAG: CDP-diacylglycerol--glycerol-3-phosphate 3-phosphatidyltransferase [Omnitrophica WOR_2 bacterium RIFCSPLOWO2_12_FULL_46_30]